MSFVVIYIISPLAAFVNYTVAAKNGKQQQGEQEQQVSCNPYLMQLSERSLAVKCCCGHYCTIIPPFCPSQTYKKAAFPVRYHSETWKSCFAFVAINNSVKSGKMLLCFLGCLITVFFPYCSPCYLRCFAPYISNLPKQTYIFLPFHKQVSLFYYKILNYHYPRIYLSDQVS